MKLQDKTILLTGASGGIGQALASTLASRGARLILTGRNYPALDALRQQLPGQHDCVSADLCQASDRQRLLAHCRQSGGIDMLINNAGCSHFSLFAQQSDADIEAQLGTNLLAPMQLSRLLLPLLAERPEAMIVNIGSTFGSIGHTGFAGYCAGKFGLRGFSEALRRELADSTIRVLYAAPRATDTAINSQQLVALNRRLGNRMDSPSVVAAAVCRAIEKERRQLFIGWPEKVFVRLNALWPTLVDAALRKKLALIKRYA